MTLQEFVQKRNGTSIEFANGYGKQCYNLMCVYFWDMGWSAENTYPYCPSGGVKDCVELYDQIPMLRENGIEMIRNNTDPNHIPQVGDVIIYGWGTYGHVEICLEVSPTGMKTIGQNIGNGDARGDDDNVKIVDFRGWNGVIGWLRKKVDQVPTQPAQESQPAKKDLNAEMLQYKYFYPERRAVIIANYNPDYLFFELLVAGKANDELSNTLNQKNEENMFLTQKIDAISKLQPELPNKAEEIKAPDNVKEEIKEAPKTQVIEPVSKHTTIFESKKAIMSLLATVVTFSVTMLNEKYQLNLQVQDILAVVSPLIIGVISQASTEIMK